ncbi:MAG: undecaprenyl-diphosphate phosphatase [Alphaproteobacteria bacterium]|nr:undecaprenyl-diphosphate phosphatase [Alphaproteobacteria bacterium]
MAWLPLIVFAIVQGLTEFLPVSSTGHLILVPVLTGWKDPGLDFDLALHVGTLLAVLIYLRDDLFGMTVAVCNPRDRSGEEDRRLAAALAVATVPAVFAGYFAKPYIETVLRSPELIAWTTLLFGAALYVADRVGPRLRRLRDISIPPAIIIGLAQCISLLPGVSRSGITMTAARVLGFERPAAARFSFLLSIPTIGGACVLGVRDILANSHSFAATDAALGALIAFVAALVSMNVLMRWVERRSFLPFVVYRLALGIGLMVWIYR